MHYKLKMFFYMILIALLSNSTYATKSVINIKGVVKDNACEVSPGSVYKVVDLLKNAVKQLKSVDDVTLMVPFNIDLIKCSDSVTAVKVGFVGISDSVNNNLIAIDQDNGSASGVGVEILDNTKTPLIINQVSSNIPWTSLVAGKNNTLSYYARLKVSKLPVTAGKVSATATFTLEYQ